MPLTDKLKKMPKEIGRRSGKPLWTGPSGEGPNGGVTQGLLSRWLSCRERFRLQVMDGWRPVESFSAPLEFGNMWHVCEEALASERSHFGEVVGTTLWTDNLTSHCQQLLRKHPMQQTDVAHWHDVTAALFPLYVAHWAKHPAVKGRTPSLQEQVFDAPYQSPSGRTVRLRGKWDSVDLVGKGIWLQENKTKSQIDMRKINRQLTRDLQTMVYLIALDKHDWSKTRDLLHDEHVNVFKGKQPILGVRYNVVRRSAHKSVDSMLKKVEDDRRANRLNEWFDRWEVNVTAQDVVLFRRQCRDPILENLCDDFQWWQRCWQTKRDVWDHGQRARVFPNHRLRHYLVPYHYDPITEGGSSELDEHLLTGSTAGLKRADVMFPELEGG